MMALDSTHVPPYDRFFDPAFRALKELGGSATVQELNRKTFDIMKFNETQLSIIHKGNLSQA